jgi:hypothetical protein
MNHMGREIVELVIVFDRSQSFREDAGGICMAKTYQKPSEALHRSSGDLLNFSFSICKRPDTEDPDRSRPVGSAFRVEVAEAAKVPASDTSLA